MYSLNLLAVFLLLGVFANQSTIGNARKHDVLHPQETFQNQGDKSPISANLGFNSKQIGELEIALNAVVSKFLGPQQRNLSLRTTGDPNTGLANTMQTIGQAITGEVGRLTEKFGLSRRSKSEHLRRSRPTGSNLKAVLYYQLLHVPLTLKPIWQEAQKRLKNHIKKKSYTKMGYASPNVEFRMDYLSSSGQLKMAAIAGTISRYSSHFYNCLDDKRNGGFDVKKALGNLTNYSPEMTSKVMTNRLDQPIPKSPGSNGDGYNYLHAFACQALVGNPPVEYGNCLVKVKSVEKCVQRRVNDSSSLKEREKSSRDFIRTIKSLDNSCMNVDKGLSALVGCKMKTRATNSNVFPEIVDFFMGDLDKSPQLRQMAVEVGSMITKNQAGSEAINEVVTLIDIYKNGVNKRTKLMRSSQKDVRQRSVFSRISAVLSQYQRHIYDVTQRTLTHVHKVASTVEKMLVDSASTLVGQDISANSQTMRSWSGYMKSVLVEWSVNHNEFSATPGGNRKNNLGKSNMKHPKPSTQLGRVSKEVGFKKSPHEKPLNKLIGSMKRLGKEAPPRRATALVSLANTFLLATMFYECISLLVGAIYRDESNSIIPPDSVESSEPDLGQSYRDRRSSPPIAFDDLPTHGHEDEQKPFPPSVEWPQTTSTTSYPQYEKIDKSADYADDSMREHDEVTPETENSEHDENPGSEGNLLDMEIVQQRPTAKKLSWI